MEIFVFSIDFMIFYILKGELFSRKALSCLSFLFPGYSCRMIGRLISRWLRVFSNMGNQFWLFQFGIIIRQVESSLCCCFDKTFWIWLNRGKTFVLATFDYLVLKYFQAIASELHEKTQIYNIHYVSCSNFLEKNLP